jgi:hypothetical protein
MGGWGWKEQARAGLCLEKDMSGHSLLWEGFLRPLREQMKGFHDWLRQRSSLFMLFRCSSISVASLIIWSMYSIWIWWIGCWCLGVGYSGRSLCCVWPWPIYLDAPDKCASGAPWPWIQWNDQSVQCELDHIHMVCCTQHNKNTVRNDNARKFRILPVIQLFVPT